MFRIISGARHGTPAKLLEAGLWLFAAGCVATVLGGAVQAGRAQRAAEEIVPRKIADAPANAPHTGELIGRLEIKGLLSVPLLENDDAATLVRGVGHIPGTAVPGGLGNLVLAGHRDTFFKPLRSVRPGMAAEVVSPGGRFRYVVDSTEVVMPEAVSVTGIGDRPEMTLITCFPFDYIGAAPKRFIVHAHLLSVDPS